MQGWTGDSVAGHWAPRDGFELPDGGKAVRCKIRAPGFVPRGRLAAYRRARVVLRSCAPNTSCSFSKWSTAGVSSRTEHSRAACSSCGNPRSCGAHAHGSRWAHRALVAQGRPQEQKADCGSPGGALCGEMYGESCLRRVWRGYHEEGYECSHPQRFHDLCNKSTGSTLGTQ